MLPIEEVRRVPRKQRSRHQARMSRERRPRPLPHAAVRTAPTVRREPHRARDGVPVPHAHVRAAVVPHVVQVEEAAQLRLVGQTPAARGGVQRKRVGGREYGPVRGGRQRDGTEQRTHVDRAVGVDDPARGRGKGMRSGERRSGFLFVVGGVGAWACGRRRRAPEFRELRVRHAAPVRRERVDMHRARRALVVPAERVPGLRQHVALRTVLRYDEVLRLRVHVPQHDRPRGHMHRTLRGQRRRCPLRRQGLPRRTGDARRRAGWPATRALDEYVEQRLHVERLVLEGHHQRARDVARERPLAPRERSVECAEASAHAVAEAEHGGERGPVGVGGGHYGMVLCVGEASAYLWGGLQESKGNVRGSGRGRRRGGRFRAVRQALAYETASVNTSMQETHLEDFPEPSRLCRRAAHGLAE